MSERFSRTELIFGRDAMEKLSKARVAVFGVGGVGGYAVEALARSGIGTLDLIDNDRVAESNINRQIIALDSTVGMYKTDAAKTRILDINPQCIVNTFNIFFMPETSSVFDFSLYDYVIDAIDTVTGKIEIIMKAQKAGVPVISSMGAGNKTDPTAFEVSDIYSTSVCPLARVMRQQLRKRGVKRLKTVFSKELPVTVPVNSASGGVFHERRQIPGSNAFVPSVAGLIIAGEVVKDIAGGIAQAADLRGF